MLTWSMLVASSVLAHGLDGGFNAGKVANARRRSMGRSTAVVIYLKLDDQIATRLIEQRARADADVDMVCRVAVAVAGDGCRGQH